MNLPNCKAYLVLSALTLLKPGTAIAANTAFLYYIANFGTVAASQLYRSLESNSVCAPNPSDPEPPAKGKTGGSRMRTSLVKVDTILISKVQLIFHPFEKSLGTIQT